MVILIPPSQFGEDDDDLLEQVGVEDADDDEKAAHWDRNVMFIVQLREAAGRRTKHLTQL